MIFNHVHNYCIMEFIIVMIKGATLIKGIPNFSFFQYDLESLNLGRLVQNSRIALRKQLEVEVDF